MNDAVLRGQASCAPAWLACRRKSLRAAHSTPIPKGLGRRPVEAAAARSPGPALLTATTARHDGAHEAHPALQPPRPRRQRPTTVRDRSSIIRLVVFLFGEGAPAERFDVAVQDGGAE